MTIKPSKEFPELMERANKIGQTTRERLVLGVHMMNAFRADGLEAAERVLIAAATAKQHKQANRL